MGDFDRLGNERWAPILDRSTVRILLCDQDAASAQQVTVLLRKCSYQVTAVRTAWQVMEVLNSNVSDVDLILSEIELPKQKGFKLLKHIVRQERLRRIPIVMISARDEMAVVEKCLRLGAADFLVKPLRTNELLNLWTHMWRRRRMLGLAERYVLTGSLNTPFDLLISDTSESNNTNSTNLFSDNTEGITTAPSAKFTAAAFESEMCPHLELSLTPPPNRCVAAGLMPSPPRKSELKVGRLSAFLTYSKANNRSIENSVNMQTIDSKGINSVSKQRELQQPLIFPQQQILDGASTAKPLCERKNGLVEVDIQDSSNACRSISPLPNEVVGRTVLSTEPVSVSPISGPKVEHVSVGAMPSLPLSQFMNGGIMNTTGQPPPLMAPSFQLYHNFQQEDASGITHGMQSVSGLPPTHGLPMPVGFSYYPLGLHAPAPQLGPFAAWAAMPSIPIMDHKLGQAKRREAALKKFKHKRKDRCVEKKNGYVSRKKLAEQQPQT